MMNRRSFVKKASVLTLMGNVEWINPTNVMQGELKTIKVDHIGSNFERERLRHPFGFKGGYLTELWQTISLLQSQSGIKTIGLATQSVLYGDADLFASHTEANGNALMYVLANKALELVQQSPYQSPIKLLDEILPPLMEEGKKITGKSNLNPNFIYNALVSVDNASWLLYAAENGFAGFDEMIPNEYKKALSHKNDKIAVMYQISYNMPMSELIAAANKGYFVFKIKTGFPGTQQDMLQKDMDRLLAIHSTLKALQTDHTPNGKVYYTMDANGRYEKKETLLAYLDYAKKIGAYEHMLLYEEPFPESNDEHVGDIDLRIVADESIHEEADAIKRLEQGYGGLVLKGIAKTLSFSMKIAKLAQERQVPCLCADLTVNPILMDWHKNLAARLAPFPGIGMGLMETNGDMNYTHWDAMKSYHPYAGSPWLDVKNGVFELDQDFYKKSGGIFTPSRHYEQLVQGG